VLTDRENFTLNVGGGTLALDSSLLSKFSLSGKSTDKWLLAAEVTVTLSADAKVTGVAIRISGASCGA
jgi:hypothetical protein